jgi:putative transposase
LEDKRELIEPEGFFSIRKQCGLLALNRSSYYLEPCQESEENLLLMKLIDEEYTRHPFYGSRRIDLRLEQQGYKVNRKRVQRLMRLMGLEAIYPKPNLSQAQERKKKYPYLLKGVFIERCNQAWGVDITYIRLINGFLYLVALIDWYSRYILSWRLSNSMDIIFCLEAAKSALKIGIPEIMNSDQGSQFTSPDFVEMFEKRGAKISWDGRGRALDNIFIERFWRSLKYEEVYLKQYANGKEAFQGIGEYMKFYNSERPHQALAGKTPQDVFLEISASNIFESGENKERSRQACAELFKSCSACPNAAEKKNKIEEKLYQI